MTLRRAARCALAGACAIHARAGASELNLLEQERAAVSSAVYPRDPAAQADACGNLAEGRAWARAARLGRGDGLGQSPGGCKPGLVLR